MNRPVSVYVLCLLHLILGLNGILGGAALILEKDGALLGMQAGWLDGSPFPDFRMPGIILFLLLGYGPLYCSLSLYFQPRPELTGRLNIYQGKYWGWTFSLFIGIMVMAWIIVQQIFTSFFWLQPLVLSWGVGIIILTLMPSVMKFYSTPHHEN